MSNENEITAEKINALRNVYQAQLFNNKKTQSYDIYQIINYIKINQQNLIKTKTNDESNKYVLLENPKGVNEVAIDNEMDFELIEMNEFENDNGTDLIEKELTVLFCAKCGTDSTVTELLPICAHRFCYTCLTKSALQFIATVRDSLINGKQTLSVFKCLVRI